MVKFLGALILVLGLSAFAEASIPPEVIRGPFFWVVSLQFSPGGGELMRMCLFNAVTLFDTANYRKARTFLPEIQHTPGLTSLSFSPDGRLIATAEEGRALIWNAADPGQPNPEQSSFFGVDALYALETPLRVLEAPVPGPSGPEGGVGLVGFSPDGKLLLTTHRNGHVNIWNTGSWAQQGELAVADSQLSAVAFAPDGKTIVVADEKGVLHEWSLREKAEIRTLSTTRRVVGLEFSRDGKVLISTQFMDKTFGDVPVIMWNTADWSAHTADGYYCAAFSHSGKLLALGARGHVKVIEPSSRKEIRTFPLPDITKGELLRNMKAPDANEKVPYPVSALAFSPEGDTLAVGGGDGTTVLMHVNLHI